MLSSPPHSDESGVVQTKSAVGINVALIRELSTDSVSTVLRQATLTNGELALLLLVLGTCWPVYNREVGCGGSGFTPDVEHNLLSRWHAIMTRSNKTAQLIEGGVPVRPVSVGHLTSISITFSFAKLTVVNPRPTRRQ